MKAVCLICLLLLSACGPCVNIDDTVEAPFQAFMTAFSDAAKARGKEVDMCFLSIRMVDTLGQNTVTEGGFSSTHKQAGNCGMSLESWEISVAKDIWDGWEYSDREQLIFHEMGHCVLGLDHVQGFQIMNSKLNPTSYYQTHREAMLDALFNQ